MRRSPPQAPAEARLPVAVITGFLGSGKTTLVKHILADQQSLRTGVIVNELCLDEDALGGEKTNKLVLIGRNLDRAQLRSRLEACLAPLPSSADCSQGHLQHPSPEVKDQYRSGGVKLGAPPL